MGDAPGKAQDGVLVDAVDEVVTVPEAQLAPVPAEVRTAWLSKIARLADELVMVLDPEVLLEGVVEAPVVEVAPEPEAEPEEPGAAELAASLAARRAEIAGLETRLARLEAEGARVITVDPHIETFVDHHGREYRTTPLSDELLRAADCVTIITNHSAFDYDHIVRESSVVVDTRNATRDVREGRDKIVLL